MFQARTLGFTVVELVIVVALIGVLAAVAMPSYTQHQQKVLNRRAAQEISMIGASASHYWHDARAYPASLSDIGMSGMRDPWGRAYVYYNIDANGKGHARKDHALNPINTDFDVYSLGKDGKTKPQVSQKDSVDDIIRANNGAFVGRASDF